MEPAHSEPPRLYFPLSNGVLMGMLLFALLFIGAAFFEFRSQYHYSFYESIPARVIGISVGIFFGVFLLQGFFMILLNREKFNLVIDEDGFHGMNGVTFIAWSEIAALWDQTLRYNARGRIHRLTITVKSVHKIIQRERGYTTWMLRTFKSPDLRIPAGNIKMKDVRSVMITLQRTFPEQIQRHHIRMYSDV